MSLVAVKTERREAGKYIATARVKQSGEREKRKYEIDRINKHVQ